MFKVLRLHLLLQQLKEAKEAVKKRFRGNAATKKTQRNLLKQQYEIFTTTSSEVLDQTFDRLQKLISQLEIHGESILQEDVNQKVIKNNETNVKGTSSSSTNTQNIAFVSSNSTRSTNGAVNTAHGATTASTHATAVNSTTIDNLSGEFPSMLSLQGNFMPPKPDLSFSGLEKFTSESIFINPIVEKSEAKASEAKPKA
ncbi:retrovirus-related pol polyprotein from transposon TNT 1-94 [Tanacetum coccineum]